MQQDRRNTAWREHRRRSFLEGMERPSEAEYQLGLEAFRFLREQGPETGLAAALAALSDCGIFVRPNIWKVRETGVWTLNGIRFCRDGVEVTTGGMNASRRFGPDGDLAFVPDRDGQAMYGMMVAFDAARGRLPGASAASVPVTGRRGRAAARIPWLPAEEAPEDVEIYCLLAHRGGGKAPIVLRGMCGPEGFRPSAGCCSEDGWMLDGWLELSKVCFPGLAECGKGDPDRGLMRGTGVSTGLRKMVEKTNAFERELELFEYRMTVGKDSWSYVKSADLAGIAFAVCSTEERDRLEMLPTSRQRLAMRSIARGFDPVHAIGYEEKRLAFVRGNGSILGASSVPPREDSSFPHP